MTLSSSVSATSFSWTSYIWKNEIALHSERVRLHFAEVQDDEFASDHNPLHMLERALILTAFSIRRMFEKKLVTDVLQGEQLQIRSFAATSDHRRPLMSQSGGEIFASYDFSKPKAETMKFGKLANEIIHSAQLLVLQDAGVVEDGLLVASDWGMERRLLHLTLDDFDTLVAKVLGDHVTFASDSWDPDTGEITATRL